MPAAGGRAGLVSSVSRRGVRRVTGEGCEAEELEGQAVGVAAAGAELCGDARDAEEAEGAGDGVADGGEGLVRGGGAAAVLPEYDITDMMVHFDGPVAAEVREQVSGAGVVRREARDAGDGDRAEQFPAGAVAVPPRQEHLPDLRPFPQDLPCRREGLDGADIDAAVAPVHGPGLAREGPPGQRVRRAGQFLLVIADGEDEEAARGL